MYLDHRTLFSSTIASTDYAQSCLAWGAAIIIFIIIELELEFIVIII